MHAPAAVTAAEQERCKALAECACVRMGTWVGRLVCGGDWQFKTLLLVDQSSNPAGKDGEEKAPPNYRQAGKQKKKEVKKSPASGRSAQTTDSKMNLPRTPNTSHPPTHHTHTPHTTHDTNPHANHPSPHAQPTRTHRPSGAAGERVPFAHRQFPHPMAARSHGAPDARQVRMR
jgi:hypothetical protein